MALCPKEAGFVGSAVGVGYGGVVGVGEAASRNGVGIWTSTAFNVDVGTAVGVEGTTSFPIWIGTVIS